MEQNENEYSEYELWAEPAEPYGEPENLEPANEPENLEPANEPDETGAAPSTETPIFTSSALTDQEKQEIYLINHPIESISPYKKCEQFLTKAEHKLFRQLTVLLDHRVTIAPKVRVADMVEVNKASPGYKSDTFSKIAMTHIDFTLLDSITGNIICCIELDDVYHDKLKKIKADDLKDNIYNACGINLFRIRKPVLTLSPIDLEEIVSNVNEYYTPLCPTCGIKMVHNVKRITDEVMHHFYGCRNYPECKETINID